MQEKGLNIGIRKRLYAEVTGEAEEYKEEPVAVETKKEIVEIFSHSVGIFRDFIPPSRKFLAKVGHKVNKGQKIGFIESMKIMKEMVSPVNGILKDKLIKHGDPVEYGQKLFEIEIV
jgi:biotin carboxyl carrier protein